MDRKNIRLPEGASALSGAVRLWPYQRAVSDAIKHGQRLQFLFPWMLGGASGVAPALETPFAYGSERKSAPEPRGALSLGKLRIWRLGSAMKKPFFCNPAENG